jgi:hypothetical protein
LSKTLLPSPDFLIVQKSDKILSKIEKMLGDEGHGIVKKLIIEFLEDPTKQTLSIHKLD